MATEKEQTKEKTKRANRRSKNSKIKAQKKGRRAMKKKAMNIRAQEVREGVVGWCGQRLRICPHVDTMWQTQLTKIEELGGSAQIHQFYEDHEECSFFLEVRSGVNVSNPGGEETGGKGVFAKKTLPENVLLCPYVGHSQRRPCRDQGIACEYDMQVRPGYVICARLLEKDHRYLSFLKADPKDRKAFDAVQVAAPCPPNYSRYVNTLTPEQLASGMSFNARFQLDELGENVLLVALRKISKGEEILADYGDMFIV